MEQATSRRAEQDIVWINGALEAVMKIILNGTETQHNYRLYLNSLKRYKTFQEELESKSGRGVQLLMSGSVAENLFAIHWVYKDGRREASNDIDVMLVDRSMEVVEKSPLESSEMLDIKGSETSLDTREHTAIKSQTFDVKADCRLHAGDLGQSSEPKSTSTPTPLARHEGQVEVKVALEDKSKHAKKEIFLVPTNHPGYVQLIELDKEGNTTYMTTESFKGFWSEVVNKTALYSLVSGPQLPSGGVVVSGPALSRRDRPGRRNNYAHDYVPCLRCVKWTTLADGWVGRKRAADWPKRGLISEVVDEGCHVVPISHNCDSGDDLCETEWRLSFSNAEKKLVDSLTTGQRQSYIMAKLIMKQVIQKMKDSSSYLSVEKTPSSYHLKTIFLWKCEEKPLKEWNNLLESVVDLLNALVDHLRKGSIPQYFIPENNLIDNIKQNVFDSVADQIAAAINDLPTILHHVFLTAYNTQLDYDERVSPILRLMEWQLKIFCETGMAGDKLYLYYILNSLIDSLSAATVGTSDKSQPLEDHKYILNIYHLCHSSAGNTMTLPSLPVLGAAEEHTILILLFRYLLNLLQNTHILTVLQTDVFAFMARLFTQNLVSLSVKEKVFTECCEASLNLYQSVCEKLGVALDSDLSCREELSTLNGIDFIFYKNTEIAKKECFQFVANRFKKFQENGKLNTVKTLSW
ncbi:hypothetical protein ACROYT_G036691 [Oculina patagonica]